MSESKPTLKKILGNAFKNYDWGLIAIVAIIAIFGLMMIYSITSYKVGFDEIKMQLLGIVLGTVGMVIISLFTRNFLGKISGVLYGVSLILILFTMTTEADKGARRSLHFGSISFQPSETAKITLILLLAYLIYKQCKEREELRQRVKAAERFSGLPKKEKRALEADREKLVKSEIKDYLITIAFTVLAAGMVALVTSDLGTAVIIAVIGFVMIFCTFRNKKVLAITFIILFIAACLFIFLYSYRLERVRAWLHPEEYRYTDYYQIQQGLYAIGSGGFLGKGLGMSTQKLGSISESQNDMIFSIVCEELGIVGGALIILLFIFLILRMKRIYDSSKNLQDKLIVVGVITHFAIQTIINIAVVTSSIPNTGVPLPFISAGGTAVMFQMFEIGLVQGVSVRNAEEIDSTITFKKTDRRKDYSYR